MARGSGIGCSHRYSHKGICAAAIPGLHDIYGSTLEPGDIVIGLKSTIVGNGIERGTSS